MSLAAARKEAASSLSSLSSVVLRAASGSCFLVSSQLKRKLFGFRIQCHFKTNFKKNRFLLELGEVDELKSEQSCSCASVVVIRFWMQKIIN